MYIYSNLFLLLLLLFQRESSEPGPWSSILQRYSVSCCWQLQGSIYSTFTDTLYIKYTTSTAPFLYVVHGYLTFTEWKHVFNISPLNISRQSDTKGMSIRHDSLTYASIDETYMIDSRDMYDIQGRIQSGSSRGGGGRGGGWGGSPSQPLQYWDLMTPFLHRFLSSKIPKLCFPSWDVHLLEVMCVTIYMEEAVFPTLGRPPSLSFLISHIS